jgi:asparagine synthase (glutamine-hydrolysing)
MCGIGGFLARKPRDDIATIAGGFASCLAHRGPDGEGFLALSASAAPRFCRDVGALVTSGPLTGALVHRRLSILDLPGGGQPMTIPGEGLWIVFNGEIYNYRELRAELESLANVPFRTRSDTEVILQAYQRWGTDGLRRLNGIFAFGLWDGHRQELVLARDPVGVKPLYWTSGDWGLAFASEITPLIEAGLVPQELSPTSLAQFLFYRFMPAPATLWRAVQKIMPGHALRCSADGVVISDVDFAEPVLAPVRTPLNKRLDEFEVGFRSAVGRQMIADVPVGAFLSGGLDSSMVVASMNRLASPVSTFAIGFADSAEQQSELPIAQTAAAELGTLHRTIVADTKGYFDRLPWAVERVEEPLAHPGMLLQADLSGLARSHVKVVLTGQGADEPLGGYRRHQAMRVLPALSALLNGGATRALVRWLAGRSETGARAANVLQAARGIERAAALFGPLSPDRAGEMARGCGAMAGREAVIAALQPWWRRAEGLDDVARTLYVDVRTSLAEDLLVVADKMSMIHGLELRVPFLDLWYLALLETIPGPERVQLIGKRKQLQHSLARRLLPPPLQRGLTRSTRLWHRKHAFDVPVVPWLRQEPTTRVIAVLDGPRSLLPNFVDRAAVRRVIDVFLHRGGGGYRMLLALYVLEIWLRSNLGAPPPVASIASGRSKTAP